MTDNDDEAFFLGKWELPLDMGEPLFLIVDDAVMFDHEIYPSRSGLVLVEAWSSVRERPDCWADERVVGVFETRSGRFGVAATSVEDSAVIQLRPGRFRCSVFTNALKPESASESLVLVGGALLVTSIFWLIGCVINAARAWLAGEAGLIYWAFVMGGVGLVVGGALASMTPERKSAGSARREEEQVADVRLELKWLDSEPGRRDGPEALKVPVDSC